MSESTGVGKNRLAAWRSRLVYRYGFAILKAIDRMVERYSLVENVPFVDPSQLAWTGRLESRYAEIRRDLDHVLEHMELLPDFHRISPHQAGISSDDKWKTFFFFGMGYRADANCARCPTTAALLAEIPGIATAMFSILSPGKHILPHRGAFKGLLTYHLGLIIPDPQTLCRIRVGSEIRSWTQGRGILFDDSIEHEVWNDSDATRVVLLIQFERPMRPPVSVVSRLLVRLIKRSSYVQDARRNQALWESATKGKF